MSNNFLHSKINDVLIVVNFPGLSAAYSKLFQSDPGLFDTILDQVSKRLGIEQWGYLSVSSFSAGYGAVREILKHPKHFRKIYALLAADSMYASIEKNVKPRRPVIAHMRDYIRFAKLASKYKPS